MKDDFSIFEALLWEPNSGYFLFDLHLKRLALTAAHFDRQADLKSIEKKALDLAQGFSSDSRKVRIEVSEQGEIRVEAEIIHPSDTIVYSLSRRPVQSSNLFLRHKTSQRETYDEALRLHPEADDVVLWNERGELTESCSANLVLEMKGRRLTPALECGLLPGTFRAYLLATGEIEEAVIPVSSLDEAEEVFLVNSVRRWRKGTPVEIHRA
ncbi:MAG: hypothetical protein CL917_17065 [Deltaproteobacteria bacterium]|nr:hypothetical protein [Deltaproteobacteria bacterium]